MLACCTCKERHCEAVQPYHKSQITRQLGCHYTTRPEPFKLLDRDACVGWQGQVLLAKPYVLVFEAHRSSAVCVCHAAIAAADMWAEEERRNPNPKVRLLALNRKVNTASARLEGAKDDLQRAGDKAKHDKERKAAKKQVQCYTYVAHLTVLRASCITLVY